MGTSETELLHRALLDARRTLQHLRHPSRRPRNYAQAMEALGQAAEVAGKEVDRIDVLLKKELGFNATGGRR